MMMMKFRNDGKDLYKDDELWIKCRTVANAERLTAFLNEQERKVDGLRKELHMCVAPSTVEAWRKKIGTEEYDFYEE